jgi:hypothetical protein
MTNGRPAAPGPAPLDPPPHLRGALRAAAAARARTARIRARPAAGEPEGELSDEVGRDLPPAPPPLEAAGSAGESSRSGADPRRPFARTAAAAREARAAAPAEGAQTPWHLQLRPQIAEASDPAPRWLSRLMTALSAPRKPVGGHPASPPAWPSVAVAGAPSRPPPAGAIPVPPRNLPAFAPGAEALAEERYEIGPPPPMNGPPERGHGARAGAPIGWPETEEERACSGGPARSRTEEAAAGSALAARWRALGTGAVRLECRMALAAVARAAGGSRRALSPPPAWARRLPVTTGGGGLPAPRLAALLATSLPALAQRSPAHTGNASGQSAAQPADPARRRGRSAARLIAIGGALLGGFGLGVVANGGALLSGSKLGHALLGPDRGLFGRSGSAPPVAYPPEPAPRPPVPEAPRAPASVNPAGGSDPVGTTAPAPRPQLADAAGDHRSVADGSSGHGRLAAVPDARNATPGGPATGWQALYAQGHRFQADGDLVAAAAAYRGAVRLNPHHPAMLYDLGYVLQRQGQSEAAMDYYRRTIALQPDHAYAHYNLGYLLQKRGENLAAARHFEIAAARLPDNPFVYYDWAWSREAEGDVAGAAVLYRKAIEIDPDRRPGSDARRRLAALGLPTPPEQAGRDAGPGTPTRNPRNSRLTKVQ